MKPIHISLLFLLAVTFSYCSNNGEQSSTGQNTSGNQDTIKEDKAPVSPAASSAAITTNDSAIALIENNKVRFKLHGLHEITPDASAPGKPEAGKKIYAAEISAEYLTAHNTSAAEYMLNSYVVDDKGNRHSLPMGSTRLAMVVSEAQAQQDNAAGEAFNQSNPSSGQTFRGRQYGFEMDAGNKPVKWGMRLDGKDVEVAIRQ